MIFESKSCINFEGNKIISKKSEMFFLLGQIQAGSRSRNLKTGSSEKFSGSATLVETSGSRPFLIRLHQIVIWPDIQPIFLPDIQYPANPISCQYFCRISGITITGYPPGYRMPKKAGFWYNLKFIFLCCLILSSKFDD